MRFRQSVKKMNDCPRCGGKMIPRYDGDLLIYWCCEECGYDIIVDED